MIALILFLCHALLRKIGFGKLTYIFKTDAVCVSHDGGVPWRPPLPLIWREPGGNDEHASLVALRFKLKNERDVKPKCTVNFLTNDVDEAGALSFIDFKDIVCGSSSILDSRNDATTRIDLLEPGCNFSSNCAVYQPFSNRLIRRITSFDDDSVIEEANSKGFSVPEIILDSRNNSLTVVEVVASEEELKDGGLLSTMETNPVDGSLKGFKVPIYDELVFGENSSLFIADLPISEEEKTKNEKIDNVEINSRQNEILKYCDSIPEEMSEFDTSDDGEDVKTKNELNSAVNVKDSKNLDNLLAYSNNSLVTVGLAVSEKEKIAENEQNSEDASSPAVISEVLDVVLGLDDDKAGIGEQDDKLKDKTDQGITSSSGAQSVNLDPIVDILLDEEYLFFNRRF